jgi:hypothetical protein
MSSSKAIIETSKKKKEKNVTCKKNHQKWKMGKSEREWMTYKDENTQQLCSLILKAFWIQRKTMNSCSPAPLQA